MIRIGLTSFSEHTTLSGKKKMSLFEYAGHLPTVEVDTAYYGIPRQTTVENWLKEVPEDFRFVVKVYQGISGQGQWQDYFSSPEEMVSQFLTVMTPLIDSGKLACFLIQFPATFKCTKEAVRYLKKLAIWFKDLPTAVEFRDASWYSEKYKDSMYNFMTNHHLSLAMIDEPQLLNTTIPLDPFITNPDFALFRFHGRNVAGWQSNDQDWRKKRTLYRYNRAELLELSQMIQQVAEKVKEVVVIFNNNSGGDAADNAKELMEIMRLDYQDLNPLQLDLF